MSAGMQVVVLAKRPVAGRVKTRLCPPYRPDQAAALAAAALADTLDAVARTPAVRRVVALGDPGTDWGIGGAAAGCAAGGTAECPEGCVPGRQEGCAPGCAAGSGVPPGGAAGCPEGCAQGCAAGRQEGCAPGCAAGSGVPPGFTVVGQRCGGLDARLAGAFADAYAGRAVPMVLIGMDTPQVTPGMLAEAGAALATSDAVLGPAADGGFWLLGLRRPDPALLLGVPMSVPSTGAAQLARLRAAGLRVAQAPTLRDVDTAADAEAVAEAIPGSAFASALAGTRLAVTG